jgi:hypothetical protein
LDFITLTASEVISDPYKIMRRKYTFVDGKHYLDICTKINRAPFAAESCVRADLFARIIQPSSPFGSLTKDANGVPFVRKIENIQNKSGRYYKTGTELPIVETGEYIRQMFASKYQYCQKYVINFGESMLEENSTDIFQNSRDIYLSTDTENTQMVNETSSESVSL